MTYKPRRDSRFEYMWDLMAWVEERQCKTCALKSDREDFPMCFEVEAEILEEKEVEALDDHGEYGVVCSRYANEDDAARDHSDQGRLF